MAYYTDFKLEIETEGFDPAAFEKVNSAIEHMSVGLQLTNWLGHVFWSASDRTWYDDEKEMAELSKQFPDILFTLSGSGESAEDLWKKYFRNGLVQRAPARIIYDEFDERKLRPREEKVEKR